MKTSHKKKIHTILIGLVVFVLGGLLLTLYNNVLTTEVRVEGGSYTEGILGTPRFINPVLAQSNADRDLTELTFSSLIDVDQKGSITYRLASDLQISADQKEYVLTLNPRASFSDGTPITARDVEFTIKKIQSPLLKSPLFNKWSGVEVKETGAQEVTFRLNQPYADFIYNLNIGVLPEHLWKNISDDEFVFSTLNTEPVGSGSYKVKDIIFEESGSPSEFILVPNEYSVDKPYISYVNIKLYDTTEDLLHAYQSKTIDGTYGVKASSLSEIDSSNIKAGKLPRTFGVFFNVENNKSTLGTATREAISLAINRNQIITEVFNGYASEVDNPLGVSSDTQYDAEAAKALLEKDGWRQNSEGQFIKSIASKNTPLRFTLAVPNIKEVQEVAQVISANLNDIGIRVDIKSYEEAELNNEVIRSRDYDALLFGYVLEKPSDTYAFWHSSQVNDPGLNISMYSNPKVDGALLNIRTKEDREDDLERFIEEWKKDMPAIFLYAPNYLYLGPEHFVIPSEVTHTSERFNKISQWYQRTRHVWSFLIKS